MSDVRWKLEVGFYPLSFILNYKNFPKDLSISRVLSIRQSADCVTIHLGAAFRRHSRNLPAPQTVRTIPSETIRSCTGWGLQAFPVIPKTWWSLTPPFHPYLCPPKGGPSAVYFLLHCPYPPNGGLSPLGSTLSCGARTFLISLRQRGHPTHPWEIVKKLCVLVVEHYARTNNAGMHGLLSLDFCRYLQRQTIAAATTSCSLQGHHGHAIARL